MEPGQPNWTSRLIPRKGIAAYVRQRTGVLVTERRIGGWIAKGGLSMMKVSRRQGGGMRTEPAWLDKVIADHPELFAGEKADAGQGFLDHFRNGGDVRVK